MVIAPLAPARTGNGLAMRIHTMVAAAARHHDVHLIVTNLSGRAPGPTSLAPGVVSVHEMPAPTADGRDVVLAWLADPAWRARLATLAPLPPAGSFVDPTRAAVVVAALDGVAVAGVVALRLSSALLGLAVAEHFGVALMVDADDDDVDFLACQGRVEAAGAWERSAALVLGSATLVTVAAPADALRIERRHQLGAHVVVVPNAVRVPDQTTVMARPGRGHILFIANLTYGPNIEAAHWLVTEVLPLLEDRWSIDLVGTPAPAVRELAGPRVAVHGYAESVASVYGGADIAVAPLLAGSGSLPQGA